ncbi:MAG: hypothetical protein WDO73_06390 [Ignavibacteriota bacterium]
MTDPLLSATARRYVARLTSAILPLADRLDRRFRTLLRQRGYNPVQSRSFLAITPAAASRAASLNQFLEQVEYNGRRLAKLNVQPGEAKQVLKAFAPLLDSAFPGPTRAGTRATLSGDSFGPERGFLSGSRA